MVQGEMVLSIDERISLRVGEILKNERTKTGLSFRDIEKITGINKATLCYMESGKRAQKITTVVRLLQFYRRINEKKEAS